MNIDRGEILYSEQSQPRPKRTRLYVVATAIYLMPFAIYDAASDNKWLFELIVSGSNLERLGVLVGYAIMVYAIHHLGFGRQPYEIYEKGVGAGADTIFKRLRRKVVNFIPYEHIAEVKLVQSSIGRWLNVADLVIYSDLESRRESSGIGDRERVLADVNSLTPYQKNVVIRSLDYDQALQYKENIEMLSQQAQASTPYDDATKPIMHHRPLRYTSGKSILVIVTVFLILPLLIMWYVGLLPWQ